MQLSVSIVDLKKVALTTPETMRQLGAAQLALAADRMAAGVESDEAPAPRYSREYSARRARKGLQTAVRDLVDTGAMKAGRHVVESDASSVKLGWSGGWNAKAYFTDKQTPWLEPTFSEREQLKVLAGELVRRNIAEQMPVMRAERETPT